MALRSRDANEGGELRQTGLSISGMGRVAGLERERIRGYLREPLH